MGKQWYESKTVWTNIVAIGADIYLHVSGHALPPQGTDIVILGAINTALRFITKDPIVWSVKR